MNPNFQKMPSAPLTLAQMLGAMSNGISFAEYLRVCAKEQAFLIAYQREHAGGLNFEPEALDKAIGGSTASVDPELERFVQYCWGSFQRF